MTIDYANPNATYGSVQAGPDMAPVRTQRARAGHMQPLSSRDRRAAERGSVSCNSTVQACMHEHHAGVHLRKGVQASLDCALRW